ncbi:FPC/CPF motif-containing protein YcgG [Rheinheimera pacifica]|uniref:guanitoxin biosynthesis heme-dependent pre-guanitoxin N-hydroxylase GntA n=1 Tax=Rheinheimera pacifica TaxID=173990 RepID=UPI000CB62635|nr:guanitoxin biosynthesis heme-dependent pre-guanitoxin N-hydroxylase GntA [Rheinheimera pacifica]MDR6983568.1 FPC/CPF motif-containing protein YcgG [Rheinheimera pacifica]PKM19662.1 MAG: YqcI/YcgG family protein [Gammaproteobacteria bacterium HGW-Gammaproteobacteria-15]
MSADINAVTSFNEFVGQAAYPCVGAKIAHNKGRIELHRFQNIYDDNEDRLLLAQLYDFIARYNRQKHIFFSFVCIFTDCEVGSDAGFERALWARLQALHDKDCQKHGWDARVSNNPADPNFSFSLGGEGFFIIGLNPYSKRRSRKFQYPAIVFNLHSQFQQLKDEEKFDSMKKRIRKNDTLFCGQMNATLADHGEASEARQYSGRTVGSKWQCPFSPRNNNE